MLQIYATFFFVLLHNDDLIYAHHEINCNVSIPAIKTIKKIRAALCVVNIDRNLLYTLTMRRSLKFLKFDLYFECCDALSAPKVPA